MLIIQTNFNKILDISLPPLRFEIPLIMGVDRIFVKKLRMYFYGFAPFLNFWHFKENDLGHSQLAGGVFDNMRMRVVIHFSRKMVLMAGF